MKKEHLVISKEWQRHGKFSGYEQIINEMKIREVQSFKIFLLAANLLKKRTGLINYSSIALSKEIRVLMRLPFRNKIHVLYADMDYYYLHLLKRNVIWNNYKNEIIATFHHPPQELERRLGYDRYKVLGALNKIIVMGRNQISFFRKYSSAEIKFIPHGIDLNFFKPNNSLKKFNQILIIGVSHRDHNLNRKIILRTRERTENINFKVIVSEKVASFYSRLENVDIITRKISDEELLNFYQSSNGVLLMLKDCTASNTLLESLATGCPVIVNDIGAVRDYIPDDSGLPIFNIEDTEPIVDYLISLCSDIFKFKNISQKQVELAAQYDWPIIAAATERFIYN